MPDFTGPRSRALFSSHRQDWETPPDLYSALDRSLGPFTLDACATDANTKVVAKYFTPDHDALVQPWSGRVWCNPPFAEVAAFVTKAVREVDAGRAELVCLLTPARFDTLWGKALLDHAEDVRIIHGRVRFVGATNNAPFPCAITVLRRGVHWPSSNPGVTFTIPTRHKRGVNWTTLRVVRDAD